MLFLQEPFGGRLLIARIRRMTHLRYCGVGKGRPSERRGKPQQAADKVGLARRIRLLQESPHLVAYRVPADPVMVGVVIERLA